jgi:tetratricopeptide (TPR) repeat protein
MKKLVNKLRKGREKRINPSITVNSPEAAGSSASVSDECVYHYLHEAEKFLQISSGQIDGRDEPGHRRCRNETSTDSRNELPIRHHDDGNRSTQIELNEEVQQPLRSDTLPKMRAEVAQQKLLQASEDLAATLQDYLYKPNSPAGHNEVVIPPDEALIICGAMDPEGFARAVEKVLAKQKKQAEGIASKIANAFGKMYPLLSLTLSLGSNVVSLGGAQVAPLQCAMNGISLLLSIAYQEHGRGDDFLKQFDHILYQSLRVAEIQNHSTLQINELLLEMTTNLMTAIILFFKDTLMFFRHDYFYNLGRTLLLGPKIYASAREVLDTAIAEFDQALLLQITVTILALGNLPKPADEHLQKSELLSWLRSSYWQVEAQHAANRELQAPGTLQWVLETAEFKTWRLSDCNAGSRSPFLWFNGPAGVGKSIIASYITQLLQTQYPDAAVLYFFCKAGDPFLDNVDSLIRTLAAQLALTIPEACERLQRLKDKGFDTKSLPYLFSTFVADVLDLSRKTFIIVDGLDECFGGASENDSPIRILLGALNRVDANVLISSRPTPEIIQDMSSSLTRRLTFEDSRDDIELYVSMRLSKSQNLSRGFARLGKEPSTFIAEKSKGNFLWVSIVLDLLERTTSAKSFQGVIDTLPESLSGMYDRVLDKLEMAQTLDVTLAILEYVLFSMGPLTIEQLRLSVGLVQDEMLDLQAFVESNCGAFLGIVPGKDGPSVQIIHETFISYITDCTASKSRCFLPAKSHARLAEACMECLLLEDEKLQPFRDYAVIQWFKHFLVFRSEAGTVSDDSVTQSLFIKIHAFFTNDEALRRWMRAFCFVKTAACEWASYADVHDEVLGWLKSDEMTHYCTGLSSRDNMEDDLKATLDWRQRIIEPDSVVFATTITNSLAWVWLNTNWRECEFSRLVFIMALTTARILQLVEPKEEENPIIWSEIPRMYVDPKREKHKGKPGYSWRYPSSISSPGIVNKEQLDVLANMGGYNSSIGMQSGNYAFGCWYAKIDIIVLSYQSAIDEYPEWWHLHEGLGDWFKRSGDDESALKSYAEAMKHDPKNHPSSHYWEVLANVRKNKGDIHGAVDAFRKGGQVAEESKKWWHWDQMAEIYKEQKDWESMKSVYREAIHEHPDNKKRYWSGLAGIYETCLDWKGQLDVYVSAIAADPNNMQEYSDSVCRLATTFVNRMLFPPAITILMTAIDRHTQAAELAQYQKALADTYMAARQWDKARDLYTTLLEGPCADNFTQSSYDLAHAHLALGNTTRALALYSQNHLERQAKGDYTGLSTYGAPAHMLSKDYHVAIRLLKADNTKSQSQYPDGPSDIYVATYSMKRFFHLGLCYEALNRTDDAHIAFYNAFNMWQKYKDENILSDSEDPSVYRNDVRPMMIYGYVLEKLGRIDEAKYIYDAADRFFAITTFVGDDEALAWEHEDCKRALERVSACSSDKTEMPSLLDQFGGMRLELRLSSYYRTHWPGYRTETGVPRYRSRSNGYEAMFYGGRGCDNSDPAGSDTRSPSPSDTHDVSFV